MRVVLQDAEVSVPNGDPERMATAVPVSVVIPTFNRQVVLAETLPGQLMVGPEATSPPPPGFDGEVGVSDPPHPRASAATSRKA